MQSSSSVPVLILVLCCMASALNMHSRALEGNENCTLRAPPQCINALVQYGRNPNNASASILDVACSQDCLELVNDFYLCYFGYERFGHFLCLKNGDNYCIVRHDNYNNTCHHPNNCAAECTETCRLCQDEFIEDLTCCAVQYREFDFFDDLDDPDNHACVDSFDDTYTCNGICYGENCSGGAIAVPTILTALLLMVMAAIVM